MFDAREQLRANDLRFLAFARDLSDRDWFRPSLCSEWSNHEVLAHLVIGYRASPAAIAAQMIRHRGSFDHSNAGLARTLAARHAPAVLIGEFAALVDRPRGVGRVFPRRLLLGDHVIHELDIALPLGLRPTVSQEVLAAVLDTQVRVANPFVPAAARARGLTLRATDVDWTYPDGRRCVTGKAAHLASALAGRPWALTHLSGDGLAQLRERV
ncbi:MAG TPA: maleylpyruvate isomerase family mycothiol-dependent enzyme [Mycobacterium sp.]|uniref:maleylpyruvate isomerase family mycothiol-dependent enzyme n=1 Tax=Mycobacterium sp. TaxID=1785 RepID=UPI002D6D68BF|nr:maleylpyruvate isomerase family mycothiol-dependent enzyme [Mycobacterium sp.]HXY66765.1 maleylpyruvate isomerase family mycothiol-dependent enzyme [Mycobacterium sp.]